MLVQIFQLTTFTERRKTYFTCWINILNLNCFYAEEEWFCRFKNNTFPQRLKRLLTKEAKRHRDWFN